MRLHELNTLEWDELVTNDPGNLIPPGGGNRLEALCGNPAVSIAWKSIIASLSLSHSFLFFSFAFFCILADKIPCFDRQNQIAVNGSVNDVSRIIYGSKLYSYILLPSMLAFNSYIFIVPSHSNSLLLI